MSRGPVDANTRVPQDTGETCHLRLRAARQGDGSTVEFEKHGRVRSKYRARCDRPADLPPELIGAKTKRRVIERSRSESEGAFTRYALRID